MILFVAVTWLLLTLEVAIEGRGTRVAELVMDERDVDEDDVKVVEPDSWDERELWLMAWLNADSPLAVLLVLKTGAVFVRARGPWCAIVATLPADMDEDRLNAGGECRSRPAFKHRFERRGASPRDGGMWDVGC